MSRDQLRLELLKITYVHGRTPEEGVDRAKVLEKYVAEVFPAPVTVPNAFLAKKKVGKS